MLRNVCDACGTVIDGEPVESEYPEALLMLDGEIAIMYENLCEPCKVKLKTAVETFLDAPMGRKPIENQTKQDSNTIQREERPVETPNNVKKETMPSKDVVKRERQLAEQVVKQFPVNLPTRNQNGSVNAG